MSDERLDEPKLREGMVRLATIMEGVLKSLDDLKAEMRDADIKTLKADVALLKNIVFGACGLMLLSMLGAVLYLVLKHPGGAP